MALLGVGRFKATVTSAGLIRKGPNNLLCFSMYFSANEYKNSEGEYEPIDDGYGIIDDMYLEKKPENGGGLSADNIKRLAHVFEWDGDFSTLAACATNARCKITIKEETYKGEPRPRVAWLNHVNDGDGGGFTVENDASVAAQAQAQYRADIRAILGGTTTTTTRLPTAPAGPPRPASPAPPASRPPVQLATAESVWDAFGKMARAELKDATPEIVQNNWFHFLKETFGTDDAAQITNWNQALVSIVDFKSKLLPF